MKGHVRGNPGRVYARGLLNADRYSMQAMESRNDGRFPFHVTVFDRGAQAELFDDDPGPRDVLELFNRNRCDRVAFLRGRYRPFLGSQT